MAMPSIPSEKGNASKVWEHKDHEFYYPLANTTAPGIQTDLKRRAWDQSKADVLVQAMKTSLNKSKDKEPGEFPIRTKLADLTTTPALRQMILTNHFELKTHDTTFYEYEVLDLEAAGQTRKKTQALFRKAIAEWSFLANNQDCFTTDGQKTIVSWKKLHELIDFPKVSVQSTNKTDEGLPFQIPITTGKTTITARFSYVGVVNIEDLLKQTQCDLSQIRKDLPSVERCINILISKSFNNDVVKSSGKKFYVRNARNALGTSKSLEIIRGYYYAVQPGIGSLLLNFNVATSAFFKPILVSDFLKDVETFGPHRFELIKRLRVYVEYEHKEKHLNNMGARIKGIVTLGNEPSENIEKLFFYKKLLGSDGKPYKLDNGEWAREKTPTTVAQHHWDVFGLKVVTGRAAVNVGSSTEPVWYAQEALRIIPYQMYTRPVPDHLTRNMVENAAYDPSQSQWLIENEGLKQMGFNTPKNEAIQLRNGVPISLYPSMLKLPSARLPFPVVQYALNSYKRPNTVPRPKIGSGWNLSEEDGFFSVKAKSLNYVLLHRLNNSTAQPTMATFDRELKSQMNKRLGMKIDQVKCINQGGSSVGPSGENLNSFLATAKNKRADLVVLMLENPDRSIYASFKTLTDRTYGLRSVCVAKPGFLRGGNKDGPKYITNIAQKVNIKLGGYNAQVQGVTAFLGKDTLVLGADVVHPGHGAIPDAPSIACIVGSVDHEGGRFLGSARLQSKDKQDREIIDHVQDMVRERILDWMKSTGSKAKPTNIIYYRDGVSEGQYDQVKAVELRAIEAAHGSIVTGPRTLNIGGQQRLKITALVGVKRHHTRFYPITKADMDPRGNLNCHPGTYVDRGVTSPYFNDFYLQSHSGIKGTARPTHYFILRNDGIKTCSTTDDLRKLTHMLCYTYCRATTGVSYATPTYYADRLCDRARLFLRRTWAGADDAYLLQLDARKAAHLQARQTARDNQYRNGQPFQAGGTKTLAEEQDEAGDNESLRLFARGEALTYAKNEFYGPNSHAGNPWHPDLAQVMFWM